MGRESGVAISCGVVFRHSLDPCLLWLCGRPAAVVLIQLLDWEIPYALGVALKRKKKKKDGISALVEEEETPNFPLSTI